MSDTKTPVRVTIAVNVGGDTKTFEADASTASNPYDIAQGLLSGLDNDATWWFGRASREHREAAR